MKKIGIVAMMVLASPIVGGIIVVIVVAWVVAVVHDLVVSLVGMLRSLADYAFALTLLVLSWAVGGPLWVFNNTHDWVVAWAQRRKLGNVPIFGARSPEDDA